MRLSLITKLTIATSLVLLTFMTVFAYVNLEALEKLLIEEAISDADKLSETIIKTTHYQMLENNQMRVYQMIQEVGTQSGIEHIRMINKNGRIIFSTKEPEIGTFLDKTAAACNMCHAGEKPLTHASTMNRSRTFFDKDGKQVLGLAKAIYNEEGCYTSKCHFHPENFRVLGVLDIIVSLDNMRALLSSYRYKIGAMTFFMLALVWGSMTLLTQKLVNQPVKHLLRHTKLLAQGELDASVPYFSTSELGELANAFNDMTLNLKRARNELEDWGKNLETKVEERTHELKAIQAQLVRSEKLASLGELVAGIAHEINNPLTGIMVFASLARDNPKLPQDIKNDMNLITRETERCAKIVKGLLEFSKESPPQKKPSYIDDIMDLTIALVENQSSFHDINIIRDYDKEMVQILIDPHQIEQVFVNILLNASHAMPDGGDLTIKTGMESEEGYAYIKVSDTGCGISEQNLEKIFDPFFTTKENRGTGLGLSVSYGIIESHGGKIEVKSKVGSGTAFTIRLPLHPDGEEGVSSAAQNGIVLGNIARPEEER
ncbi:MAG: two-component system NtrC family sensor [Geobacteraceae bacterium]|nr:MAG: two-component system NtrC family sensor [Geobacteraceae bacterium]